MAMRVLGLMSGTSADGVDGALLQLRGRHTAPSWQLLAEACCPYDNALRQQILAVGQGKPCTAAQWLALQEAVTEAQAVCARQVDPERQAQLVGCHGQTVWHRPPAGNNRGGSVQLLQGPLLARLLNRPVVFDFRAQDLAWGGQGAPLVPPADAALLGRLPGWRALLNLGGVANLTFIPPSCGPDRQQPVTGWDCGPGNSLLDLAMVHFSSGALQFDAEGALAAAGIPQRDLVQQWLQEPYFQQPWPKSTGREQFGQADLQRRLVAMAHLAAADVMATLTAFTAAAVVQSLAGFAAQQGTRPIQMLVAGGGASNQTLLHELRRCLPGTSVIPVAGGGLSCRNREAAAFAVLAWWRWQGKTATHKALTGVSHPVPAGVIAWP